MWSRDLKGGANMLRPTNDVQVFLYAEPVDMRKSIDGLSVLVEQEMNLSPNMTAVFVFCNRGRDKIKLLCWERNGFIVWYKRLETQRFHWPRTGEVSELNGELLNRLLDGFNIVDNQPHQPVIFDSVS